MTSTSLREFKGAHFILIAMWRYVSEYLKYQSIFKLLDRYEFIVFNLFSRNTDIDFDTTIAGRCFDSTAISMYLEGFQNNAQNKHVS